MKKLITLSVFVLIIFLIIFKLQCNKSILEANQKLDENTNFAIPVVIYKVESKNLNHDFAVNGTFSACKELIILAEGQGKIIQIFANSGDYVTEGQILAKMDDEMAKSQYQLAEANFQKAGNDLKKFEDMAKNDAATNQQLAEIRLAYQSAQANLTIAKKTLEYTIIKAPFSGTIVKRLIEKGAVLAPGTPTYEIVNIDRMKFITSVAENELIKISKGQKVTITSDIRKDSKYTGEIVSIGVKADDTKKFPVEIELINTDKFLKAGMYGTAGFAVNNENKCIVIPRSCLLGSVQEPYIFLVSNSIARQIKLKTGKVTEKFIEVIEGLKEGDTIVSSGQINLEDSTKVTVIK